MTDHQLINTKLIKDKINAIYGHAVSISVTKQKRTGYTQLTVKVLETTIPMRNPDRDLTKAIDFIRKMEKVPSYLLYTYSGYGYWFKYNIENIVKKYYSEVAVYVEIPIEVGNK